MAASSQQRYLTGRVFSYIALGLAVVLVLFPIYWMVATSLKLPRDILRVPSLWPSRFTLANFEMLLADNRRINHPALAAIKQPNYLFNWLGEAAVHCSPLVVSPGDVAVAVAGVHYTI